VVGGVRLDVYSELELRSLSRLALREHAERLQRVLGGRIITSLPTIHEDLIAWVLSVQRLHLEPLRLGDTRLSDPLLSVRTPRGGLFGEGMILAEAHSKETQILTSQFPSLSDAVVREIRNGIRKFHDGVYGADLDVSQKKLAEDIYAQLCVDRPDSFWSYRDKFTNFSVAVGPISFSGSIPCFCFKVAYPQKWSYTDQTSWITIFYTLKESELRMLGLDDYVWDAPLAIRDSVVIGDVQVPISSEAELRSLDRLSLRDRADLLYRTLGSDRVMIRPPDAYDDLVSWILRIQRVHLEEFRAARLGLRAYERNPLARLDPLDRPWREGRDTDGSRIPLYSDLDLRTMDRVSLRDHATMLYTRLGSDRVGFGLPTSDADLADWILRWQRMYADGMVDRSVKTDRFGDRVETERYIDISGEEVTKSVTIDKYGDQYEQTIVRDPTTNQTRSTPRLRSASPRSGRRLLDEADWDRFRAGTYQDRLESLSATNLRRPMYRNDPLYRAGADPLYRGDPSLRADPVYRRSVSPSRRFP